MRIRIRRLQIEYVKEQSQFEKKYEDSERRYEENMKIIRQYRSVGQDEVMKRKWGKQ